MRFLAEIKAFLPIFSIISLIAFLSCHTSNPLDSSENELLPVEGNIIFAIYEGYANYSSIESPRVVLSMVTEKIYPCYNYSIKSRVIVQSNHINITLLGIYVPKICETLIGPASFSSFLDVPVGVYSLNFSFNNITDRYILTVTDSYIKVTKSGTQFTKPEFELYWRYPPNSFAYLCGATTATSWICDDFLDTLLSKIELKEF